MKDLIIIGGSAAGAAAAIYAARRNLNFKMVYEQWGGEVATSGEIGNWPGIIETNGIELSRKFKEHIDSYEVEQEEGTKVERVEREGGNFVLKKKKGDEDAGEEEAKSVIITTGIHPRELNVPGEKEFRNKGVSYCTVCDGPLFKDKVVATIGGGNSALESAIMLKDIAKKVYLLTIYGKMKGDSVLMEKVEKADNIELVPFAFTKEVMGDNKVTGLKYDYKPGGRESEVEDTKEIEIDGIFVHIGQIPNSDLTDAEKDKWGGIIVDCLGRTNIEGLFAAGDVTNIPYKQIAVAAGQGVAAALSAVDYLNKKK